MNKVKMHVYARRCTSIGQKLPKQLEEKLSGFFKMRAKFLKIRKYPPALIGNMDETPVFFDMAHNHFFFQRSAPNELL